VEVTTKKIDDANVVINATIPQSAIDSKVDQLAQNAGRSIKVDGFRKGKVPAHVVKKLHGEKLEQDAQGEALREVLNEGSKQLELKAEAILGEPLFKKFDKTDDAITVEIELSLRPDFEAVGYVEIAPKFDMPEVSDEELNERVDSLVAAQAPFEKIAEDRGVENGDMVKMNFSGSIDGVKFDGGTAEDFNLRIGSGQFIPGFEDQMVGMKMGEEKTITVTFPESYHAKDLAGKDAQFEVKVNEIQAKTVPTLDDELAKKLLHGEEGASVEMFKERVAQQIRNEKLSKIYNEELKPQYIEALVRHFEFALPNNIVEQEIDAKVNAKASQMSKEELESYKENPEKVNDLREEVRGDARDSVAATFIVDVLARKEEVSVSDQEVTQTLYYEAYMSGQDPQQVLKYYQQHNLLPAIKMGMIEDKLFSKILGLDK